MCFYGRPLAIWFKETDAMNYHIMLPRQHLICIRSAYSWAADDLSFANSVCFSTLLAGYRHLIIPQFLFLIGLIFVAINLASCDQRKVKARYNNFCILGSHHFGIQMGTAMWISSVIYSWRPWQFLRQDRFGRHDLHFLWSKPLIPFQTMLLSILWSWYF